MSDILDESQVAVAALDGAKADALVQALRDTGAHVQVCETAEALASHTTSGEVQAAVLATASPANLSKPAIRALLGAQADTSVTFLVPDRTAFWKCDALRGATLDQVRDLRTGPAELVDLLRTEVSSVLVSRPEYLVVCVDDDQNFLDSLEGLLPPRLDRACGRFRLRFEFCSSPDEALSLVQSPDAGELALVISDQVMPGMSGVALLGKVKAACPKAQRVLLTGYAGLDSAIVAINEHMLDKYLTKPIDQPAAFVNSLQHSLGEYHLARTRSVVRQRLVTQFELVRALSLAPNLKSTMEAVGACLGENLLSSRRWAVLLHDEDDLVVQDTPCLPPELAAGQRLSAQEGLAGWVLKSHRPVFAARTQDLPARVTSVVPAPLMAVPLAGNPTAMGLILVSCSAKAPSLSRLERIMLSFVAEATGIAVGGLTDRQALQDHYVATMASLNEAVEAKDVYTRGHTDRVCDLTMALARACGMGGQELKDLERASLLHDIGKIAISDAIVDKPGPLTPDELAIMKEHSARGERILRHLKFLEHARLILRSHHERYDGKGYPDGLTGEEIPLGARMLAVADSYDAMTSTRPYRQAMAPKDALAEIERNAGRQFDPAIARNFLELMRSKADQQDKTIRQDSPQEVSR